MRKNKFPVGGVLLAVAGIGMVIFALVRMCM